MLPDGRQRTLARTAAVSGFGYWSGQDVHVEFRPAPPDTGVVFVRGDYETPVKIPALVENRVESPRRTELRAGGVSVAMVEHILAALSGLQIDNCEVWVDAEEMPGCDGSSLPFVEALLGAGIEQQASPRTYLVVRDITRIGNEDAWIEARPGRPGELSVKYRLDYGRENPIGRQTLAMTLSPEAFQRELAPCRTFLLKAEAEWLQSQGLGQRATTSDVLVFGDEGPIDNPLRFPDECVRHKVLDLVGDLALAGCQFVGQVTAHRSGHRLNADLVRVLLDEGEVVGTRRLSA